MHLGTVSVTVISDIIVDYHISDWGLIPAETCTSHWWRQVVHPAKVAPGSPTLLMGMSKPKTMKVLPYRWAHPSPELKHDVNRRDFVFCCRLYHSHLCRSQVLHLVVKVKFRGRWTQLHHRRRFHGCQALTQGLQWSPPGSHSHMIVHHLQGTRELGIYQSVLIKSWVRRIREIL